MDLHRRVWSGDAAIIREEIRNGQQKHHDGAISVREAGVISGGQERMRAAAGQVAARGKKASNKRERKRERERRAGGGRGEGMHTG
jgi:hypothetical protein